MKRTTKTYILDVVERAVVTFAEVALSMLTVGQAFGEVDWLNLLSVAGVATVISVLKSIVALRVGDEDTASLVHTN